jgi:hypothetical protein
MKLFQKQAFGRAYKRLHANTRSKVDAAIHDVMENLLVGELKKADLAGVRVHKFRVLNQQYLLAYEADPEGLTLLALGVHENFYRDLKKSRG